MDTRDKIKRLIEIKKEAKQLEKELEGTPISQVLEVVKSVYYSHSTKQGEQVEEKKASRARKYPYIKSGGKDRAVCKLCGERNRVPNMSGHFQRKHPEIFAQKHKRREKATEQSLSPIYREALERGDIEKGLGSILDESKFQIT